MLLSIGSAWKDYGEGEGQKVDVQWLNVLATWYFYLYYSFARIFFTLTSWQHISRDIFFCFRTKIALLHFYYRKKSHGTASWEKQAKTLKREQRVPGAENEYKSGDREIKQERCRNCSMQRWYLQAYAGRRALLLSSSPSSRPAGRVIAHVPKSDLFQVKGILNYTGGGYSHTKNILFCG